MDIEWIKLCEEMRKKGYCYAIMMEEEKDYLFFKTSTEIGPFIRSNFPDKKMLAMETI